MYSLNIICVSQNIRVHEGINIDLYNNFVSPSAIYTREIKLFIYFFKKFRQPYEMEVFVLIVAMKIYLDKNDKN